jgi:hypothetical protein
VQDNKPFRARLRNRYKPSDYVKVINIDDEPYMWKYFPPDGENSYFTDDGMMRVVEGRAHFDPKREELLSGNEQLWVINPGQTEILQGSNADLFIEGLYRVKSAKDQMKRREQRSLTNPDEKDKVLKFGWTDGSMEDKYIDQIFLGVEKPVFNSEQTTGASSGQRSAVVPK